MRLGCLKRLESRILWTWLKRDILQANVTLNKWLKVSNGRSSSRKGTKRIEKWPSKQRFWKRDPLSSLEAGSGAWFRIQRVKRRTFSPWKPGTSVTISWAGNPFLGSKGFCPIQSTHFPRTFPTYFHAFIVARTVNPLLVFKDPFFTFISLIEGIFVRLPLDAVSWGIPVTSTRLHVLTCAFFNGKHIYSH